MDELIDALQVVEHPQEPYKPSEKQLECLYQSIVSFINGSVRESGNSITELQYMVDKFVYRFNGPAEMSRATDITNRAEVSRMFTYMVNDNHYKEKFNRANWSVRVGEISETENYLEIAPKGYTYREQAINYPQYSHEIFDWLNKEALTAYGPLGETYKATLVQDGLNLDSAQESITDRLDNHKSIGSFGYDWRTTLEFVTYKIERNFPAGIKPSEKQYPEFELKVSTQVNLDLSKREVQARAAQERNYLSKREYCGELEDTDSLKKQIVEWLTWINHYHML